MASNMQIQSEYQNNSASKGPFRFRGSTSYNFKGPGPLEPHSSQLRNVAASKANINPYSRNAASTSNYFNKKFESNVSPATSLRKKYNIADDSMELVEVQTTEKAGNVAEVRVYSGGIDKLIKWHKMLNSTLIIYEVIGCVIQMRQESLPEQRIMLLRSCKETGPVLQVIYYTTDRIDIKDFHIGQKLRCAGRMTGTNMLRAHYIRNATAEEVCRLSRMQAISDRGVSMLLKK